MKSFRIAIVILINFFTISGCYAQEKEVLVFYKTEGFWHNSIPAGTKALEDLGEENGFAVEGTDDAGIFNEDDIKRFNLVIFLNTTGNILNEKQQQVFEDYINSGGNFFGIHAAADTEYDWEWYGKLVGAYFKSHPKIQEAVIIVEKPQHPAIAHYPERFKRKDEWYNYKNINPEINVLLRLDESSYQGGENGQFHPLTWYRNLEGGGKMIYTGGGHTIESYTEPSFLDHLRRCIFFALGEEGSE